MAKCLRCGAGNEWIQGDVKKEPSEPHTQFTQQGEGWVHRFNSEAEFLEYLKMKRFFEQGEQIVYVPLDLGDYERDESEIEEGWINSENGWVKPVNLSDLFDELYDQIRHGDEEHQLWLKEKIKSFYDSKVKLSSLIK